MTVSDALALALVAGFALGFLANVRCLAAICALVTVGVLIGVLLFGNGAGGAVSLAAAVGLQVGYFFAIIAQAGLVAWTEASRRRAKDDPGNQGRGD